MTPLNMKSSFSQNAQPRQPVPPTGLALWSLGFRPFYLLAGIFAAVSILNWVAQLGGWTRPYFHVASPLWHAHEMIFGYALAVIVGFLFTAVRNWTNKPTPTGWPLAAIAALWLAGRILVLTPWPAWATVTDTLFALAAATGLAIPLLKARNRRNYFFIALIAALGAVNLFFGLAMSGLIDVPVERGLQLGIDLILFVTAVMGGRVIPMFTANAIPGTRPIRIRWLERIALGSILALIATDMLNLPALVTSLVAGIAAVAHGARLALWQPWHTVKRPILWILHASYAWITMYLALRGLAAVELVPIGLAIHAFTIGAIGGLTLGMMTRTARGHTGRALEASPLEVASYSLIQLAALARVFIPLVVPQWYLAAVVASGLLWVAAFVLFILKFWPILLRPRIDGHSG